MGRELPGRPPGPAVQHLHHRAGLERDHGWHRQRAVRRRESDAPPADGRLPSEGSPRPVRRPPGCHGDFDDVPCPSSFANWIEALADQGITGGCGGDNYCPQNPVRRDQMAVFLLKAKYGADYMPPACTGVFPDVPCSLDLCALDRAARRGGGHRRLRQRQLLPSEPRDPRPNGGVSRQDVRAPVLGQPSFPPAGGGGRTGLPSNPRPLPAGLFPVPD